MMIMDVNQSDQCRCCPHLEVSKNVRTPESGVYRVFHYKSSSYWGTPILGNNPLDGRQVAGFRFRRACCGRGFTSG